MSDGLDVHSMTRAGLVEGRHVSLVYSFASVEIAERLHDSEFSVLPRLWRYAETLIPPEDIPRLIEEVSTISSECSDPQDIAEFDRLKRLLIEADERGTGICAQGP